MVSFTDLHKLADAIFGITQKLASWTCFVNWRATGC